MPEIETFKTVYITLDLSDGKAIYPINIPFDVDEIVLKYFSLKNATPDGPDMVALGTNLIGDYLITFPEVAVMFETLKTSFKPNIRRIQGEYEFTAYDLFSNAPAVFTDLKVSFALMFIKYKK